MTRKICRYSPRERTLERLAPTPRGEYRQIFLVNAEQVVLVFSCAQPEPSLRMLDRFLVIAEKQQIPPLIVANKIDLVGSSKAKKIFSIYSSIGYPVIYTSALTGRGTAKLRKRLKGMLSALAGPSGAGKSSLLRAIQPELDIAIREVSKATSKGRHTTKVREMFPLDVGGYVVDMPGLRILSLWDTEPEELDGYFPELVPLIEHCQFNDCTHRSEPGCAVIDAVSEGKVHEDRYESYLRLRFREEEY